MAQRRNSKGRFAGSGGGKSERRSTLKTMRSELRTEVSRARKSVGKGSDSSQSGLRSAMARSFNQRRRQIREVATASGVARGKR